MDKLNAFVINLKDQLTDTQQYHWQLDDEFFAAVQGKEIEHGDAEVDLEVRRTAEGYELAFSYSGVLTLLCDRCLEPMQLPFKGNQTLKARMGESLSDDGDIITVPAEDGTLSVAWSIYELIALEIPLRHVHSEGECPAETTETLQHYSPREEEETNTDPRWDALKEILDNN